jgi:hypothetical protein
MVIDIGELEVAEANAFTIALEFDEVEDADEPDVPDVLDEAVLEPLEESSEDELEEVLETFSAEFVATGCVVVIGVATGAGVDVSVMFSKPLPHCIGFGLGLDLNIFLIFSMIAKDITIIRDTIKVSSCFILSLLTSRMAKYTTINRAIYFKTLYVYSMNINLYYNKRIFIINTIKLFFVTLSL